jgi:Helix-turn-helix domain
MSVRVLSWVFDHSPVEHRGDLLVLLVLADHAHDDGTHAFPSVETIARKARLSRRGAQLALRRLERLGAIQETAGEGPRRPRSYRLIMGEATSPRTGCTGEVGGTEGRTESHLGAKGSSPEPSVEPSVEPSLSLSSEAKDVRESEFVEFDNRNLLAFKGMAA